MSSVSEALRSVDLFNKNCHLMFNGLCSAIGNIITPSTLTGYEIILGNTFGEPWIGLNVDKMYSDNRRHYMFKLDKDGKDLFYFIMMLVKMRDDLISDKYKDMAQYGFQTVENDSPWQGSRATLNEFSSTLPWVPPG